jgi:hypothetical protein
MPRRTQADDGSLPAPSSPAGALFGPADSRGRRTFTGQPLPLRADGSLVVDADGRHFAALPSRAKAEALARLVNTAGSLA